MDQFLRKALSPGDLGEEDMVKAVFQAMLGCGHLLGGESSVTAYICRELAQAPKLPDEPLFDDISRDYVRLNIRPACRRGLRTEWIARLMQLSARPVGTREDVARLVTQLEAEGMAIHAGPWLPLIMDELWLPSHSPAWREKHHPAYRIIRRELTPLLPILEAIAHTAGPRILISIDGPCGSGKTTLARQLAHVLQAQTIHTDDFVVPHSLKTPERLAQPGGNEDHERLARELAPWLETGTARIRPYACMRDELLPEQEVTGDMLILEGSYANMPLLRSMASVRVWVSLPYDQRLIRIAAREGQDAIPMFLQRWIPLEDAYHQAFGLPDEGCILVDGAELTPLTEGN